MEQLLQFIDFKTAMTLAAGYVTMRADLKWMMKSVKEAKEAADEAHNRITKHVEDFHTTKARAGK